MWYVDHELTSTFTHLLRVQIAQMYCVQVALLWSVPNRWSTLLVFRGNKVTGGRSGRQNKLTSAGSLLHSHSQVSTHWNGSLYEPKKEEKESAALGQLLEEIKTLVYFKKDMLNFNT